MDEKFYINKVKRSRVVIFGVSFALSLAFFFVLSTFALLGYFEPSQVVFYITSISCFIFIFSFIGQFYIPQIISHKGVFHILRRILWSEIKSVSFVVGDLSLSEYKKELENDKVKHESSDFSTRASRAGARSLAYLFAEESPGGRLINNSYIIFSKVKGDHFLVWLAPYKLSPKEFIDLCLHFNPSLSVEEKILPMANPLVNTKKSDQFVTLTYFSLIILGGLLVEINDNLLLPVVSTIVLGAFLFLGYILYVNTLSIRRLLKNLNS